jgi:polysaccharide biosynthesis protein PslG
MSAQRGLVLILSATLVGGLLTVGAAPVSSETDLQPRSAAVIAGTPIELLASAPSVAPLAVGYKSGMFLAPNALTKRNKRGCTLRNELLIKMAVKKPKVVGRQCALQGGEWLVDFGTKRVKKASQVKLGKLLPDKYVYAQGAFGWNPEQRRAYATTVVPPKKATRGMQIPDQSWLNQYQPISPSAARFLSLLNGNLDRISALGGTAAIPEAVVTAAGQAPLSGPEAELAALKAQNPTFFTNWTIATLMNAKSWGISFAPMVKNSFEVTLRECAADATKGNICNTTLTFPSEATRYNITVVPQLASTQPAATSEPLRGYGTPTGPVIDRHLFGMHAPANWFSDEASGAEGPTYPETIPSVPVGYLRLWDTETTWRDIEPTKGQFIWRKLERQIQSAQVLDAKVMMVLGGTPAWAGDGSVTSAPNSISDWRAYVKAIACRFPNSIQAYEIWNEANLQTFYTGSAAQMADLTFAAFEEIRACSPNALVVAASTTTRATGSFATFFPAYLEELKKRNWPADAYSVHSYPTASGGAEARIQGVGQFRTMLALAGAPFTTVFDSEVNYGLAGLGEGKRDIGGADAMTLIARTYVDSARYGFGSTFWYVWTANPDSKFGIQFTPNTSAEQRAWRTTYDWLVGAQYQRCFGTDQQVTVCQFNKGPENFSIVWRGDVGSVTVPLPAGYLSGFGSRSCDLNGDCTVMTASTALPLGPMPVRIDGPPAGSGPASPGGSPNVDPNVELQDAPTVLGVEVTYEPSNKANALASWAPPVRREVLTIVGYDYEWRFCAAGSCRRVAGGSTGPDTLATSIALPEGPGTYEFAVRVRATIGTSTIPAGSGYTTQRFTQLSSRAAPPNNVLLAVRDGNAEVVWEKAAIQKGKAPKYEVQARNVTTNGKWKTFDLTAGDTLRFKASDIGLSIGQIAQARVRTVLGDGQSSAFIASNEYTSARSEPKPIPLSAEVHFRDRIFISAMSPSYGLVNYPTYGYQARLSYRGGPWATLQLTAQQTQNLRSLRVTVNSPAVLPYQWFTEVTGFDLPRGVKADELSLEIRAVGDGERFASEWVPAPIRVYY